MFCFANEWNLQHESVPPFILSLYTREVTNLAVPYVMISLANNSTTCVFLKIYFCGIFMLYSRQVSEEKQETKGKRKDIEVRDWIRTAVQ